MKASRFLLGAALGGVAGTVALAYGLPQLWVFLIAIGVAAVIWLRLYRLDKLLSDISDIPNPFD